MASPQPTQLFDSEFDVAHTASPAAMLTAVIDSNTSGAGQLLPASAKMHLHELTSENAVLKARLRSTVLELKNTRELCNRLTQQAARSGSAGGGRGRSSSSDSTILLTRDSAAQTKELKGLRPLSAALRMSASSYVGTGSLTTNTVAVQTAVGGRDCIIVSAGSPDATAAATQAAVHDEVRRLKAEVLRSHAECSSLQHAIQIMKNAASGSPSQPASPEERRARDAASAAVFGTRDSSPGRGVELAKESHLAAMDRIATLTEALNQANASISELERDATRLRNELADARQRSTPYSIAAPPAPPKPLALNKGTNTDDAQFDVRMPEPQQPQATLMTRIDRSHALEQTLEMTRAQLNEALDELSVLRGTSAAAGNKRLEALMSSKNVAVGVDFTAPIAEVFTANGLAFTVESAEELTALRIRHLELVKHTRDLEAKTLISTHSSAVRELQGDLESARKELTAAHRHIDELHYALELEKRERFNPQNLLHRYASTDDSESRQQLLLADDAQKQAAAEIAFLCDTLAATKNDAEAIRTQLEQVTIERDSALHSFRELKARTESVLAGCQEITEATRADADNAIAALTHTIHQKDSEIFSLRGQIAALQRDLDKAQRGLTASQKENDALKQRVATVQSAMSKLREDSNAQSLQLREVRAQLAAQQHAMSALSSPRGSSLHPTPRVGGSASRVINSPPSRATARSVNVRSPSEQRDDPVNMSSIEALQRALDEREQVASESRRLGDYGSPSPHHHGGSASPPPSAARRAAGRDSSSPPRTAPNAASQAAVSAEGLSYDDLKGEYEEFRSCFLVLAAVAPNATTAREVTDAVTSAFEAQRERCAAVEKELRKRTTTMQALKKELDAKREALAELEKKASMVAVLEQRITTLTRQVDKMKRQSVADHQAREESEAQLRDKITSLEEELEQTRVALSNARQELMEGRELMIQLIGEDEDALAAVTGRMSAASERTTTVRDEVASTANVAPPLVAAPAAVEQRATPTVYPEQRAYPPPSTPVPLPAVTPSRSESAVTSSVRSSSKASKP